MGPHVPRWRESFARNLVGFDFLWLHQYFEVITMGLGPFSSHHEEKEYITIGGLIPKAGNPNPSNFQVLHMREIGRFAILEVKYPDCNNYEGRKILVINNMPRINLEDIRFLDPHFHYSSNLIARFVPTIEGWIMAVKFAKSLA